jgi:t-SNARE complex subunit (syntaxin)
VATAPTAAGRFVSWLCFGLCLAVAALGIVVIVFGKQIFG